MLPSREEAQRGTARHSEAQRVQRCTEMRRECTREFLRASETVRERHGSARLHAQWKGACLAAICCVCCRLSSSEISILRWQLPNHVTCSITRHVSDYVFKIRTGMFHVTCTYTVGRNFSVELGGPGGSVWGRRGRGGAGVGESVVSANVTFFSSHDLRYRLRARPGQTQLADWNYTPSAEPSVYNWNSESNPSKHS